MSYGFSARNANGTEVLGTEYRVLTFGDESFYMDASIPHEPEPERR